MCAIWVLKTFYSILPDRINIFLTSLNFEDIRFKQKIKLFQSILDDLRKKENEIKMILEESENSSPATSSIYSSWHSEFLARYRQVCYSSFYLFRSYL